MNDFFTQEQKNTENDFNLQYDEIKITVSIKETTQNNHLLIFIFHTDTHTIGSLIEGFYNSYSNTLKINMSYPFFRSSFENAVSKECSLKNPFAYFNEGNIVVKSLSENTGFCFSYKDTKDNILLFLKHFLENNVETADTALSYVSNIDSKTANKIVGKNNIENTPSHCCTLF